MNAPQPASEFERYMAAARHLSAARSYERAAESMRQAIALQPDDANAHGHYASILNWLDKHQEAAHEIEIALSLNPEDAYFHSVSGRISSQRHRWKQAQRSAEHAISLEPQSVYHYLLLAEILNHRVPRLNSNLKKAEAAARRAVALRPDYAETHRVLGNVLTQRKKKAEARAHFELALSANPENSAAHSGLGGLLLKDGIDPSRVLGHVQASLRQNPSNRATQRMLSTARNLDRWQPAKLRFWNATFARIPLQLHKPLGLALIVGLMPLPVWLSQTGWKGAAIFSLLLIPIIFGCVFILTVFKSWLGRGPQE